MTPELRGIPQCSPGTFSLGALHPRIAQIMLAQGQTRTQTNAHRQTHTPHPETHTPRWTHTNTLVKLHALMCPEIAIFDKEKEIKRF